MSLDTDTLELHQKLFARLNSIMAGIDRIGKDSKNDHQNFRYASEHVIKEAFRPLFLEHKVMFRLETAGTPIVDTSAKSPIILVPFKIVYTDVETGYELSYPFYGSASSATDKGMYIAMTGALKYALLTSTLTPTGDDPDPEHNRNGATDNTPINTAQGTKLLGMAKKKATYDEAVFFSWASKRAGIPVENFEDIPARIYGDCERALA